MTALPAAGNHNIQTNAGQFLSLANPNGAITLVDVAANNNQVWNFQIVGGNYTIQNVGQNAFAQSALAADAQVIGGADAMNWTIVVNGSGLVIRPTANDNFRWNVGGGGVNLLGNANNVAVQNAQRFTVL